jgi:hypothetical protein
MSGEQLASAQKALTEDWARSNPELAASLEGKDYKSQYEHVRARAGVKMAKKKSSAKHARRRCLHIASSSYG